MERGGSRCGARKDSLSVMHAQVAASGGADFGCAIEGGAMESDKSDVRGTIH